MYNAADAAEIISSGERNDDFGAIASSLFSLVEHVQASISLIEAAIAREISTDEAETGNVIVLDDVTPRYLETSDALNACSANLGTALHVPLDSRAALRRPLTARG
jgi:hypothetical protein